LNYFVADVMGTGAATSKLKLQSSHWLPPCNCQNCRCANAQV